MVSAGMTRRFERGHAVYFVGPKHSGFTFRHQGIGEAQHGRRDDPEDYHGGDQRFQETRIDSGHDPADETIEPQGKEIVQE